MILYLLIFDFLVHGEKGIDGVDSPLSLNRECGIVPEICQRCPIGKRGEPGV
jgi:hypothetical protein